LKSSSHSVADLQTSLRAAFSAAIAICLAELFQLHYPLYAMISAVIVTDLSPSGTRKLGVPRVAGTVLGAGLGAAFSMVLPPAFWAIGIGIFFATYLTYILRLDNSAKLAGYICAIVMMAYASHPWTYALYRLLETSLGIAVAMAVSLVPKLLEPNTKEK
jgi:uncharacterized membrane protein YgaE (UPF0421/DUF939 family)